MTTHGSERPGPSEHDAAYTVLLVPERGAQVTKLRLSGWHVGLIHQLSRFKLSTLRVRLVGAGALVMVAGVVGMAWQLITLSGRVHENTALKEENFELKAHLTTIQEKIGHVNEVLGRTEQLYARLQEISQLSDPDRKLALDAKAPPPDPRQPVDPAKLSGQLDRLGAEAERQTQAMTALTGYFEDRKALLASAPAIWPVRGWVTSDFGYRLDPFTGQRKLHEGLDIANAKGTAVVAPADGTVLIAAPDDGYGNVIVLDHGFGLKTRYGHLSRFNVQVGERVKRGQTIGFIGSTGRSTGPHLHYEVRVNGEPVDPRKFILETNGPDDFAKDGGHTGAKVATGMGD